MKKQETSILIERVCNGYIITTNGNNKAVATDKKEVGQYFAELLKNSINCINEGQIASIEISAELKAQEPSDPELK